MTKLLQQAFKRASELLASRTSLRASYWLKNRSGNGRNCSAAPNGTDREVAALAAHRQGLKRGVVDQG